MKLDLDWELGLFQAAEFGWRKLFGQAGAPSASAVELAAVKEPMTIVARALTGMPIEIKAAEDVGGRDGDVFLLPQTIDFHPANYDNRLFYLFRTVYLSIAQLPAPGLNEKAKAERETVAGYLNTMRTVAQFPMLDDWLQRTTVLQLRGRDALTGLQRALLSIIAADSGSGLRSLLAAASFDESLSRVRNLEHGFQKGAKVHRSLLLWGRLYASSRALSAAGQDAAAKGTFSTGTEVKAPPRENVKLIGVDEERWKKKPVAAQFESVESVEEYGGSMKQQDGSDTIQEDAGAMNDLNLREVIRSNQETKSIFKSDLLLDASAGDAADQSPGAPGIAYDEWDYKLGAYRKEWCRVYPQAAPGSDPAFARAVLAAHQKSVRQLDAKLARFQSIYRERPRYADGHEIDMDAAVDMFATLRAGHTPNERVYKRSVRSERDTALLVLLDLSLSTDSYVQGRRVLDVARESLVLLGETWMKEGAQLAIAGFYSNTRHACQYVMVKNFEDSWARAKGRLGGLEPAGYTRIGPAMRHASAVLKKVKTNQKCLLLLTDGKPNDYDRYEGRHGIQDVKQAVREATQQGILVHALAIEASAKDYLPAMMGNRRYRILPRPEQLSDALSDLLLQLKAKRA